MSDNPVKEYFEASEKFQAEVKEGGQGSGRYPKGSGQEGSSGKKAITAAEAETISSAAHESTKAARRTESSSVFSDRYKKESLMKAADAHKKASDAYKSLGDKRSDIHDTMRKKHLNEISVKYAD